MMGESSVRGAALVVEVAVFVEVAVVAVVVVVSAFLLNLINYLVCFFSH